MSFVICNITIQLRIKSISKNSPFCTSTASKLFSSILFALGLRALFKTGLMSVSPVAETEPVFPGLPEWFFFFCWKGAFSFLYSEFSILISDGSAQSRTSEITDSDREVKFTSVRTCLLV